MHLTNTVTKVHPFKRLLIPALVGLMPFQPIMQAASSLPTGGTFTAGTGKISASGSLLTITQNSLKGIVDWHTFSIGRGSTVSFKNGSGATLNLVTGGTPSTLLGQLLATGNLYLLNPEGVLIGKGATVRTGGDFVASTLTLPAAQFLSNVPLLFSGSSQATVVNLGSISSSGGNIYLIGRSVQNGGSIDSPNGTAGMAAGSQVLISDTSDGQKVAVEAPGGDVTNTGFIKAAQVELKSNGGNIYALAGSNGGYINASGTAKIDGHVWLIATDGTTNVSAPITATNSNGQGGAIETSGAQVNAGAAQIKTGKGGNWLLDPDDLTIDSTLAATIDSTLNGGTNVTEQTGNGNSGNGDLTVASSIAWTTGANLTLSAFRNVVLNAGISNTGSGNLTVRADNTSTGTGTISGSGVINWSGSTGNVALLYNPSSYASPTSHSANFGSANGGWAAPVDGSVSSQYTAYMLVNSAANLQNLDANDAGIYALGKDIDLSSIANFVPLGSTSPYFTGILDGMGHTITNLTLNDSAGGKIGMFAQIGSLGKVRNLNFTNGSITESGTNSNKLGLLVGEDDGTVSNVSVAGAIDSTSFSASVGGLVGTNTGTIQGSQSSVSLTLPAGANYVGGLVGDSEGPIYSSNATVSIPTGEYVGGLTGYSSAPISNSWSGGAVSDAQSNSYIGGLVGYNAAGGTIMNSYSTGNVLGGTSSVVGGLAGYSSAAISHSYATGNVTGNNASYTGGLVGQITSGGTVSDSYATGTPTGGDYLGGLVGSSANTISNAYATGSPIPDSSTYYMGGLVGMSSAAISDSHATGTVNCTACGYVGGLIAYAPIGATISTSYATGAVTGGVNADIGGLVGRNNDTVTSSYATGAVAGGQGANVGGLSGHNEAALSNSYATGSVAGGDSSNAGGLVGASSGAITSSYATGAAATTANGAAGGLVGQTYTGGTISTSYATGAVSGGNVAALGGLVGQSAGAIDTSYALGSVNCTSDCSIGGLVGSSAANISVSYAMGAVTAGSGTDAGGLVGDAFNGNIFDTYARGAVTQSAGGGDAGGLIGYNAASVTVTRSYSSGLVTGLNNGISYTGAFIGGNSGTATFSYFDNTVNSLSATGSGAATGMSGLPTSTLQSGAMPTGFNATNTVWVSPANVYPYFGWQGPLVPVGGQAFNGASAIAFAPVGILWRGSLIATTTTQSNGGYYILIPQNMTVGGLLTYLQSGGTANSFTDGASPVHFSGMQLQNGDMFVVNGANANLSSLNSEIAAALGNQTGLDFLFSVPGGHLSLGRGTNLFIESFPSFTIDQPLTASGSIFIQGLANLTIGSGDPLTVGAGKMIVLADGTTFTNNAGPGALVVSGGGNWYVLSQNPANDTVGGLTPDFIQYNIGENSPAQANNGLIYTIAPVLTPVLTGTVSKTYDGTSAAALTSGNFAMSGVINGDTVTITTPTTGTYASPNAGTGIGVTAPGVAFASATNGSIPVYGYQLAGSTATGNVGVINPATLTYIANPASTTYGAGNPAFSGTVTGFVNGETITSATTGTAAFTSSATAASNVGNYAINGSGLTAINGNYLFTQADTNSSALTINPATLTYFANPVSLAYGAGNPGFSGTVTGFVNNQTLASATTGTALFTSSANSTSAAGSYAINGSGLTANNGNYVFTQAPSNATALTITAAIAPPPTPTPTPSPTPTPAPTVLTFVIGNATGLQNSNPTFSATYTGSAISGLNIGSILSGLTFTITPAISGPGIYTITATGTAPAGYTLNITPATLTLVGSTSAILPTQAPLISPVMPELLPMPGGNEATSLLPPLNSVGLFQVNVTGSGSSAGASFTGFASQQAPLAQAGFFGTSDKKDTYSAGAKP